jgi:hypothetical protein
LGQSEPEFMFMKYREMISKYKALWTPAEDKEISKCFQDFQREYPEVPSIKSKSCIALKFKIYCVEKVSL